MKLKGKEYQIAVTIILAIGIMIRIINITNMPNAVNVDEVSSGYEAYSILNYGMDRNGNFMPAFLVSWGGRTKCTINIPNNSIYKIIWCKYF